MVGSLSYVNAFLFSTTRGQPWHTFLHSHRHLPIYIPLERNSLHCVFSKSTCMPYSLFLCKHFYLLVNHVVYCFAWCVKRLSPHTPYPSCMTDCSHCQVQSRLMPWETDTTFTVPESQPIPATSYLVAIHIRWSADL